MSSENLKQIGDFLRCKRESLTPEMMGLPKPARTRTPGLRREDVASLAGISVVWYSKIERGKAAGISSQALAALGKALRLTRSEAAYLNRLLNQGQVKVNEVCHHASQESRQLLMLINPLPALLMNDYFDIIESNHSFNLMCGLDINALAQDERNYIYLTMTHPVWQKFLQIKDESTLAMNLRRQAGFLRNAMASRPNDERLKALVNRFHSILPMFAEAWNKNTMQQHPAEMLFTFDHCELGTMTLRKQVWWNCCGDASGRFNIYHTQNDQDYKKMSEVDRQYQKTLTGIAASII